MPSRVALLAGILIPAIAATADAARAEVPYSPVTHNIEEACNALAKDPPGTRKIVLVHVPGVDGSAGTWRRADEKAQAVSNSGASGSGELATVREGNAVLLAIVTTAAATPPTTRAWCFLGGRLSRADIALPDPDSHIVWRRAEYFQGDVDVPDADIIYRMDMQLSHGKNDTLSKDKLPLDAYPTPSGLPFYSAYREALTPTKPARR